MTCLIFPAPVAFNPPIIALLCMYGNDCEPEQPASIPSAAQTLSVARPKYESDIVLQLPP
jgi:hypothetical protein